MHKFIPLAFICLVLASCGGLSTETTEAEVVLFHERFNAEEFRAIYDGASEDLKEVEERENFLSFLQAIRGKLGAFKEGTRTGWSAIASTKGSKATLVYQSTFEHGSATETFVFIGDGDDALLQTYSINSRALIMDRPPEPTADGPSVTF